MANSLYPGFINIFYTGYGGHAHTMRLPVIPSPSGGSYVLEQNDGTSEIIWTYHVEDLVDKLILWLKAPEGFSRAELWTLSSPTADPVFAEAYEINREGTASGDNNKWTQAVWTHRTRLGGIGRFYLMEANVGLNLNYRAPLPPGTIADLSLFLTGTTGFVRGRDGSQLVAPISYTTKINDSLRRKYLF